ncbi:hypothetical protein O9X98_10715 [Agrobacterium salinitolerans]|nr:hypothetical protein [Agrobacterium salinitolerans]
MLRIRNLLCFGSMTLAFLLPSAPQSLASEDNTALMRAIEKSGFSGKNTYSKFTVTDVKFQANGNYVAKMDWKASKRVVMISGSLTGWTLTFKETQLLSAGRGYTKAGIGCAAVVKFEPGDVVGRGPLVGCPKQSHRLGVRVDLPVPTPRDTAADAAAEAAAKRKAEEERIQEKERPLNESIFAVSAAQFVSDNCPALAVDYQTLTDVLKARGVEYGKAQQSPGYAENMKLWKAEAEKNGMPDTCYMFQAHFFSPRAKDMARMIARKE